MVRDYETPTVPPSWEAFAQRWADRVGLADRELSLACSPDRYGMAIILRLIQEGGTERIATRRSSDADDAAERRRAFLDSVRTRNFKTVEIDVAGYFIGEGTVECGICDDTPAHEEWQHAILRELLRIVDPPDDPNPLLSPEEADEAEIDALNAKVASQLRNQ